MRLIVIAAALTALANAPALAQTPQSAPPKADANCTTHATTSSGQTTGSSSGNSMSIDKSAILPSAGNHANSAAPTVQSDGKPMEVRPDCPPDQAKPTK